MFIKTKGYGCIVEPDKPNVEHDTFACNHCNRVTIVPARCPPEDLGGFCKVCGKLICPQCVGNGHCLPWEEKMQRIDNRNQFLRSAGLM